MVVTELLEFIECIVMAAVGDVAIGGVVSDSTVAVGVAGEGAVFCVHPATIMAAKMSVLHTTTVTRNVLILVTY
jgi:hypothetical protein